MANAETAIHTLLPMPGQPNQFLAVNRTSTAHIVTLQGQVLRSFSSGKQTGGDFTCAAVSPQGRWAYCAGEDGKIYCFDLENEGGVQLDNILTVGESVRQVVGLCHHPHRNLLASHSDDGFLRLWKP